MYASSSRRGIVLLVVLSVMILFLLIGITYVLNSTQFKKGAGVAAQVEKYGDNGKLTTQNIMLDIIRGNNNPQSSVQFISLLEGIYGTPLLKGTIDSIAQDPTGLWVVKGPGAAPIDGLYNGCVFTITSGNGRGVSSRIVNSAKDGTLYILPLSGDSGFPSANPASVMKPSDTFLINGRPYSGTGPGFNPATGITDYAVSGRPLALLPNSAGLPSAEISKFPQGGMNVDYTAPDFNSMYVAWMPATPGAQMIPSYHRPELINYWVNKQGGTFDNLPADLQNQIMFRPNKKQHPVFCQTVNPTFDPINGPWDVDNDADGNLDSIWIDVGFPVMTAKDGRQYKPLAAILCLDMDGRINVNAHGNLAQANATGASSSYYAGGAAPTIRGLGYGAAEINLGLALSAGEATTLMGARHGDGQPGSSGVFPYGAQYQFTSPNTWSTTPGYWGSAPDIDGRGLVGLDLRGYPLWVEGHLGEANIVTNNPYKANLGANVGRPSHGDQQFTAAELERLLREYDIDASLLPSRLRSLINPLVVGGVDRRYLVTTDGYAVPTPSALTSQEMRTTPAKWGNSPKWSTVVDMLRSRLVAAGVSNLDVQLALLLPRELRDGIPLNLNKSYGYGPSYADDALITPALITKYPTYSRQIQARHLYVLLKLLTDDGYLYPTTEGGLTDPQKKELTSRRLAQWAINAVQFLYNDSVMVPFEYEVDPFTDKGWYVDGDLSTASTDNTDGNRRVVWGCAFPELLLTETASTHDRRVRDTANDTNNMQDTTNKKPAKRDTMKNADDTLDQVRVPEGSLFFELYCARAPNSVLPADLYTGGKLDLTKMAPASASGGAYPVWRVAITRSTKKDANADILARMQSKPDTTSLNPDRMSDLDNSAAPTDIVQIDRIVWFTTQKPTGNPDANKIFYNRGGNALVTPGTYAIVGPRAKTAMGMDDKAQTTPQVLNLSATGMTFTGTDAGSTAPGGSTKPAVGIICGADAPTGWPGPHIGMNISEPLPTDAKYYQKPSKNWPGANAGYDDAYGEEKDMVYDFPDKPFDSEAGMPLKDDNMLGTGTYKNVRTLFLQRLADPSKAWDKDVNPYVTIDWMPTDLTVFNGMDQNPNPNSTAMPFDPDDQTPGAIPNSLINLATRQRGLSTLADKQTLWPAVSEEPKGTGKKGTNNFPYEFAHTFGYLNKTYEAPSARADSYVGDPSKPFPWLTWNARPYLNPYELMLVPCSSPSRLTTEFSVPSMATGADMYSVNGPSARYPYRHLLNFFQAATPPAAGAYTPAGNLHRLFDYVGVPSQFYSAVTWLNESKIGSAPGYHPPFNYVSNFRDPGKVNLNTIADRSVWQALLNGAPGPTWEQFVASRRGTGGPTDGTVLAMDSNVPTYFQGAFRSAAGGDQVPLPAMRRSGVEAGLLRPDRNNAKVPLLYVSSTSPSTDTTRNAYFTYQQIQRLANLTTNRSNVFAVWVTVGYFEVSPNGAGIVAAGTTGQVPCPDGYQLGSELGSDTGDIKRHRLFFMFDRTIPVAFERGVNHNVHKAILVQKYIE